MNDTERHFQIVNLLARRFIAPGFIIGGTVLTIFNAQYLLPGATIDVDGVPTDDIVMRIISVVMPLVGLVFGVLIYKAKPIKWPTT